MDGLRMRMVAALAPWVIGALVLASALPAGAQPAQRDQVAALNIRAMNEYGNFEFDRAQELLEEALALCQRHRITDTPLARTYMNLAIVAIGARQDTGAGLDLFVQALNADANHHFAHNAYDCLAVIALAAQSAGSSQPRDIASSVSAVTTSGTRCSAFVTCSTALLDGRNINYNGPSGNLTIDADGNVTTAIFERFTFDDTGRDVPDGSLTIGSD